MARRSAHAEWTGELVKGRGAVHVGGEGLGLAYTPAWLQEGAGTNPEELLAAAHAASFAMALQEAFSRAHYRPGAIRVRAELHLDHREGAWVIARSDLEGEIALEGDARMRDILDSEFQRIVQRAATKCPVSRALAGLEITVDARQAAIGDCALPSSPEPRPVDRHPRSDGRERRALEGALVGRIRTRAGRRHPATTRGPSAASSTSSASSR